MDRATYTPNSVYPSSCAPANDLCFGLLGGGLFHENNTNQFYDRPELCWSSQEGENIKMSSDPGVCFFLDDEVPETCIDTLAEWSKAVDSSSTIFGCVGSNPTAVISTRAHVNSISIQYASAFTSRMRKPSGNLLTDVKGASAEN